MFCLFIVMPLIVSASACNNMISGIDKLASGVDITKYDNSGLNRGTWTGGSKYPLIAISCKKNESWINPFSGIKMTIPDQIPGSESIKVYGGSASDLSTITITTYDELYEHFRIELKEDYLFGMISDTKVMEYTFQQILQQKMFLSFSKSVVLAYTLQTVPIEYLQLSPIAKFYVGEMQSKYSIFNNASVDFYNTFIDYFGTHGVSSMTGGSIYSQFVMTSSSYLNTHEYGDASLNAGLNLLNLIDQTSGISGSLRKIDELWKKLAQNTTSCLGGSGACPSSVETKKQWSLDSFINPWVLKMEFYPVSNLLPANLKVQYDIAVLNHILMQFAKNIMVPFYKIYGSNLNGDYPNNLCFKTYCTNLLEHIGPYERG